MERCQNYAPGSNLQRQAGRPLYLKSPRWPFLFPSVIYQSSECSLCATPLLSSPLQTLKKPSWETSATAGFEVTHQGHGYDSHSWKTVQKISWTKQKNTFCLPEVSFYVKAFYSMLETPTLVEEPRADETSAFTLCPEQANTRLWFFSLFSAMKQKFQYTRVKTPPSFRRRPHKPSLGLLSAGPP